MLQHRKAHERGFDNTIDWLKSFHTFSFANYYDPRYIHFSHLRVMNEDFIAPNQGFGLHPHKDMEILTYVLSGRVAHQDSMGNKTEVRAGEFQIMSAGSGIQHAEINPSTDEPLHLYQIWVIPNQKGITPRYAQGKFADKQGATLILSPNAEEGSFQIYQDMKLWRHQYHAEISSQLNLDSTRNYYLQVTKGSITINQTELSQGYGLAVKRESQLHFTTEKEVEFLLFDLA